jgi:hypothetical protein
MRREDTTEGLLAACSARLDTDACPQGTAFFVAPGYAITAAHVIGDADGLQVQLVEGLHSWHGHVADVRPLHANKIATTSPYTAPDVALIEVDDGPEHACALLSMQLPGAGARVMARGYTRTFDQLAVTPGTETFRLTGTLETPDRDCKLLKLSLGEVTKSMSGAPVLDLSTGDVIGMLRTSRKLGSSLGGWVVPADSIRLLWPDEVGLGNDRFHERDPRWHEGTRQLRGPSAAEEGPSAQGGFSIEGDVVSVITGGHVGSINIEYDRGSGRRDGSGTH